MKNSELDQKTINGMVYILAQLNELGFAISGIEYKFVSCSSHRIQRQVRGIDLAFDNNQMELITTGIPHKLDVFAYYNEQCFLLKYNN